MSIIKTLQMMFKGIYPSFVFETALEWLSEHQFYNSIFIRVPTKIVYVSLFSLNK